MEGKGKKGEVDGLDGEGGAAHTYYYYYFPFFSVGSRTFIALPLSGRSEDQSRREADSTIDTPELAFYNSLICFARTYIPYLSIHTHARAYFTYIRTYTHWGAQCKYLGGRTLYFTRKGEN